MPGIDHLFPFSRADSLRKVLATKIRLLSIKLTIRLLSHLMNGNCLISHNKTKKTRGLHTIGGYILRIILTTLQRILVSTGIPQSHVHTLLHFGIGISAGIHYHRCPLHTGLHSANLCNQEGRCRLQWWDYTALHSGTDICCCSEDPNGCCHKLERRWRKYFSYYFYLFILHVSE